MTFVSHSLDSTRCKYNNELRALRLRLKTTMIDSFTPTYM